jgi:hypothetical protein
MMIAVDAVRMAEAPAPEIDRGVENSIAASSFLSMPNKPIDVEIARDHV